MKEGTGRTSSGAREGKILRCGNCGAQQRQGDWVKAMDAEARAAGKAGFVNLSAPEECLNCGSTDLLPLSKPRPGRIPVSAKVARLADQFARAGQKWEKAHILGLEEAQRGVMTHYEWCSDTKEKMEQRIQRLITKAQTSGLLDKVILRLQRKGEKAALYVVDSYL